MIDRLKVVSLVSVERAFAPMAVGRSTPFGFVFIPLWKRVATGAAIEQRELAVIRDFEVRGIDSEQLAFAGGCRAVILSTGKQLRFDLPQPESSSATRAKQDLSADSQSTSQPILTAQQMHDFEAENIRRALEATDGKLYGITGAAELLGMKPTTLASRLKKLVSR